MNPVIKYLFSPSLKQACQSLPTLQRLKQRHEDGYDPILRKATALIQFHTPKSCHFGCEDANLACQNASLMAQSLGISQIYMGYVIRAIAKDGSGTFSRMTGVDEKIHAIMAPGVPSFQYPRYTER